jgi:general secretion pathway protein F
LTSFRYRAASATGQLRVGVLDAASALEAADRIRRLGLIPLETAPAARTGLGSGVRADGAARQALVYRLGELAVLLDAGLPLDRALAICGDNADRPGVKAAFGALHAQVKEGRSLSQAMAEASETFPPIAVAMVQAGETDGRLGRAIGRLAATLDRAEALRRTIVSSLIYPALLTAVAGGVISLMMLFVVPQFETLFTDQAARLPVATRVVIGASHALRRWGLAGLVALGAGALLARGALQRPAARRAVDRMLLSAPLIGVLTTKAEVGRFSRVLSGLIEGGVALPTALTIAGRSLDNSYLAEAVSKVASGLKEGAGLSTPLAATRLFPPMAISFVRTGEETATLGPMLDRLADVLERDVKTAVDRLLGLLTPVITLIMALAVGGIIASIISAILGFNDLALGS